MGQEKQINLNFSRGILGQASRESDKLLDPRHHLFKFCWLRRIKTGQYFAYAASSDTSERVVSQGVISISAWANFARAALNHLIESAGLRESGFAAAAAAASEWARRKSANRPGNYTMPNQCQRAQLKISNWKGQFSLANNTRLPTYPVQQQQQQQQQQRRASGEEEWEHCGEERRTMDQ
jgi:hypothetical protein